MKYIILYHTVIAKKENVKDKKQNNNTLVKIQNHEDEDCDLIQTQEEERQNRDNSIDIQNIFKKIPPETAIVPRKIKSQ